MPQFAVAFVRYVDAFNKRVGRFAMYLFFAMGGILLASTVSRVVLGYPFSWALEMSQFILSAYYILGGAYTLQLNQHVRMDLVYDQLTVRRRATVDAFTILFVIFYLVILLGGGLSSTEYAIKYGQRNYTAWGPVLWPIKVIMTAGIFFMLLQTISCFIKDIAIVRGKPIA